MTGKAPEKRPQVWALYKEVQRFYDMGLRVPDDVIMLLSDDNWGNVRRLPNAEERKHPGGGESIIMWTMWELPETQNGLM